MSTLAFIPIRAGSKSIAKKNIRPLLGKPLVYWNLKALEETEGVDRVVVALDSDEFEAVVSGFGFSKVEVYRRSAENAQDTSSTESVMLEYLDCPDSRLEKDDLFMLVQATSPLTAAEHFRGALSLYAEKGADSLLSCVRMKRFLWNEDGTSKNYDFRNRPRRQDFDGDLVENGAFYINTVMGVKESGNRLSGRIAVYEMPEYTFLEIDEPDDWIHAESLMRKYGLGADAVKPEIKLFLTDVDGVLTDAGMYYGNDGGELKKFNTKDGKGFEFLRSAGIKTGIITAEDTHIVARRAAKLKIDYLFQGAKEKLSIAKNLCEELDIGLENLAYIGDDLNDKDLLSAAGLAACPADAAGQIKKIPGIKVLESKGGCGAVREYIEYIVE